MVSRSNGILGRLRVLKGRFGSPSVRAITVVTLISVLTFTGAGLSGLTSADQTKASQESNGTRPANGRAKEPAQAWPSPARLITPPQFFNPSA